MYRKRNIKFVLAFALGVSLMFSGFAYGDADLTLGLDRISNNSTIGDAIGDQINIEVFDASPSLQFLVSNLGPDASIVVRFYWKDSPNYLDFSTLTVPTGWEPFVSGDNVGARTSIPRAANGLGPGEMASFYVDYASGANFASFLNALQTGELEMRVHIRGIDGALRETYRAVVAEDNAIVPLPAPFALSMVGMACVAAAHRRSRSRNKVG